MNEVTDLQPVPRARAMPPFRAMQLLAEARRLESQGRDIIHMEVGEPDFKTPQHIIEAAFQAAKNGFTSYTPAEGIAELREALADTYEARYGVEVNPDRFIVTVGSSPALWLIFSAILEPGDVVMMCDPHYACYPNDVRYIGGEPVTFPVRSQDGFRLDPGESWSKNVDRAKAFLVNSPSNPTGAVVDHDDWRELAELPVPYIISDEIYHGIEYGVKSHSALEYRPDAFVVSGFSKLYAMTGWRLGWIICPENFIEPLRRIHQNLFLCASSFVQKAGIAALTGPQGEIKKMVETYDKRRVFIVGALRDMGFDVPVEPKGAFYILTDARHLDENSERLSHRLLNEAGVAVTPGIDFGQEAEGFLRFSYATSIESIAEGMKRIKGWIDSL
ncbi:aspartate aminotransferase [candidate division LCP-89 bacterium B3_LCP]|uniref:Aminotransferase n=1 Tax=candidate division LCP-89 bacterium B3_LCP TaxID=2012998 RepID=A0A532V2S2_UNCL8|nr:MAG: aspartate aminotransferase [candidate division LCP-89 bacterium B3_LCP]